MPRREPSQAVGGVAFEKWVILQLTCLDVIYSWIKPHPIFLAII